jgi:hypothetical protein
LKFKTAAELQAYPEAVSALLKRINTAADIYHRDRSAALRRTFNPKKTVHWLYESMGQMPKEHIKHWLVTTWSFTFKLCRNCLALIGLLNLVVGTMASAIDVGSFLGHRSTIEKIAHKVARCINLEKHQGTILNL